MRKSSQATMQCPLCGHDQVLEEARFCPNCGQRLYLMAGLDYTELVTERTQGFTGREWVFRAIDNWLADPQGARVFLLTGGPGTGKTAIAAQLVRMAEGEVSAGPYPHLGIGSIQLFQFCQAFHNDALDPLRFTKHLSLNLASVFPLFAEALVEAGAGPGEIHVVQEVGTADRALVVGTIIQDLHIGNLSARVAFDRVVAGPLKRVRQGDITGTILILLDALDEALSYPRETLADLLGHVLDDPRDLPPQVRFLITSRPDERVTHLLGQPALDLIMDAPADVDDVQAYAHRRLRALDEPRRSDLADRIADASEGNFLFARYVIDDLPSNLDQVEDPAELPLPEDLHDVYRQFLKRELGRDRTQWRKHYSRLFGILAVTRGEGLRAEQLAGIAELPRSRVDGLLENCGQYLTGTPPEGPFRIYHQSFRDFLLSDADYQVYPQEANEAIADFFSRTYGGRWLDCTDDYAWRHVAVHLAEAMQQLDKPEQRLRREQVATDLVALLNSREFLVTSFLQRFKSSSSFARVLPKRRGPTSQGIGAPPGLVWASQEVVAWLTLPAVPICLLTGEVGSETSALAAHLVEMNWTSEGLNGAQRLTKEPLVVVVHLCTPIEDWSLILADLVHQLASRYRLFAEALLPLVEHEMSIDTVQDISVADTERLLSGWVIGTLEAMPPEEAFERTIGLPLERLCTPDFEERLLFVIDATEAGASLEPLLDPGWLPRQARMLLVCHSGSYAARLVQKSALGIHHLDLNQAPAGEEPMLAVAQPLEMHRGYLAGFDPRSLAWLALVPAWTDRLAEECGFPTGGAGLSKFLTEAVAVGLCERVERWDQAGSQSQHFWMSDAARDDVLDALMRALGPPGLLAEAAEIGQQVILFSQRGETVSPAMGRWAQLAIQVGSGVHQAALWLGQHVRTLVQAGDTTAALEWLETGTTLARVFGGELDSAVRSSGQQLDLAYQRKTDQRRLEHYLVREEQFSEVHALLEGPDDVWALHIVGRGGSGKTMLLRYIRSQVAPERGITTSQVDVDALPPDWPMLRPGALLMAWADGLRAYCTSLQQEAVLDRFETLTVQLHEPAHHRPKLNDPLAMLGGPDFELTLASFIDFLHLLPQPVLVTLDQCEGLCIQRSTGSPAFGAYAVFHIIEKIHHRMPQIRVILAGRRLMAEGGYGWRIAATDPPASHQSLLPVKPYLRLCEVRGFTQVETSAFLARQAPMALAPELKAAILERCTEHNVALNVAWAADTAQPHPTGARYNPFELALYASWMLEDPSLTEEMIHSSTSEDYLSIRIVSRIRRREVREVLPAVILLGRFNWPMLRPLLDVSDAAFDKVYGDLADQEWIEVVRDPALQTTFLEVDRTLRRRLLDYYSRPVRAQELEKAREKLRLPLAEMAHTRSLDQVSPELLDAALRVSSPQEAAMLWGDLNQRITGQAMWRWAESMTARLLGEDGLAGKEGHPLRAAVMATYASARIHNRPLDDLGAVWTTVAREAAVHPDPAYGQWLARRAMVGQLATCRLTFRSPSQDRTAALWQMLADLPSVPGGQATQERVEQWTASLCAAVDALLEVAESNQEPSLVSSPFHIMEWAERLPGTGLSQELTAFADTLAHRALMFQQQWSAAPRLLAMVETQLSYSDFGLSPQRWADWCAPQSLRDRVRLELLRTWPPNLTVPEGQLEDWQDQALGSMALVDAERLVSQILQHRVQHGQVPVSDELERLGQLDTESYGTQRRPVCVAHRVVPPLFAALARCWSELGYFERAMTILDAGIKRVMQTDYDAASFHSAEQVRREIALQIRPGDPN